MRRSEVLLLGEGNFSFALALARQLKPRRKRNAGSKNDDDGAAAAEPREKILQLLRLKEGPVSVTATSFDIRDDMLVKYPEFAVIGRKLVENFHRPRGDAQHEQQGSAPSTEVLVSVVHGVNAWDIDHSPLGPGCNFDRILWNHPHLGVEDFRLHRFLLSHFFHECSRHLRPGGLVGLTLVEGQEQRWGVENESKRQGFKMVSKTLFDFSLFPGFETRRNKGGKSFQNLHTQKHTNSELKSWHWVFQPDVESTHADAAKQTDELFGDPGTERERRETDVMRPKGRCTSQKVLAFQCLRCPKRYSTEQGVFTHSRQTHDLGLYDDKCSDKHVCSLCSRKFNDDESLWQHRRALHAQPVPPAPRPLDPLLESGDQKLEVPSSASKGAFRPCEICWQAIPSHWTVEQHLELLKPLVGLEAKCFRCGKLFGEFRAAKQHENFCGAMFQPDSSAITM